MSRKVILALTVLIAAAAWSDRAVAQGAQTHYPTVTRSVPGPVTIGGGCSICDYFTQILLR